MTPLFTDEVPAASSCGATNPVSFKHADLPVTLCVVSEGIRGHVTDLHFIIVPLEVLKLHPEDKHAKFQENIGSLSDFMII